MADQAKISDTTLRRQTIQLLAGMVVGLGFGLVMSLVSNGFVTSVLWLTSLRETKLALWFDLGASVSTFLPLICLLLRVPDPTPQIDRHTDGIDQPTAFTLHRTDNELDEGWLWSTLAALISAGGGAGGAVWSACVFGYGGAQKQANANNRCVHWLRCCRCDRCWFNALIVGRVRTRGHSEAFQREPSHPSRLLALVPPGSHSRFSDLVHC